MKKNLRPKQTAPVVRTVVNSSNNGSNQSGLEALLRPFDALPFAGDDAE